MTTHFWSGFVLGVISFWVFFIGLAVISRQWQRAIEREVNRREREARTAEWEASKVKKYG